MIVRFTQKLCKKLNVIPEADAESKEEIFSEWYAHLFNANKDQYILFTDTLSLYSVIIPAQEITSAEILINEAFPVLNERLLLDGCPELANKVLEIRSHDFKICKTKNRKVLGSMNDMIANAKFFFAAQELAPIEISRKINNTPYNCLKYELPVSIIKKFSLNKFKLFLMKS